MKKVLGVLCILLPLILWVLEPFYYIPFYQPKSPISSVLAFDCEKYTAEQAQVLQKKSQALVEQSMANNDFLGVSTGIYQQDCGHYIGSAGFRSKVSQQPFTHQTVSRIASVTKPMTAIAIMQLYEQGLLKLDTPISEYFTYLSEQHGGVGNDITIRHLLTHTSGIAHYQSKLEAVSFTHYASLNDAAREVLSKQVIAPAGEKFVYSSYGYSLLGAIIEKVSGLSFEQYLQKHIWDVAGMSDTRLESTFLTENKSRLYIKLGSSFIRSPYSDLSVIASAGGVQSTASDLLKFGQAVLANKLIASTSLDMMIMVPDSLAQDAGDDPYGFGWSVYNDDKLGRIIAHSGSQPGASAYFRVYLDQKLVVATLSNAFGTKSAAYQLSNRLSHLAFEGY